MTWLVRGNCSNTVVGGIWVSMGVSFLEIIWDMGFEGGYFRELKVERDCRWRLIPIEVIVSVFLKISTVSSRMRGVAFISLVCFIDLSVRTWMEICSGIYDRGDLERRVEYDRWVGGRGINVVPSLRTVQRNRNSFLSFREV